MSKRTLVILAACALLAATGAGIAVHRAHGSQRTALWQLSNGGQRVAPKRDARRGLQIESARLLAVRDGRAFYELQTPAGRCFGVGSAASVGDPGGEACPTSTPFPSALRPVLDFSVYEGQPGDARASLSIVRIEGFAADGVAAVGILNGAGRVTMRVPVSNNVYELDHTPPGLKGSVVPLDSDDVPLGR